MFMYKYQYLLYKFSNSHLRALEFCYWFTFIVSRHKWCAGLFLFVCEDWWSRTQMRRASLHHTCTELSAATDATLNPGTVWTAQSVLTEGNSSWTSQTFICASDVYQECVLSVLVLLHTPHTHTYADWTSGMLLFDGSCALCAGPHTSHLHIYINFHADFRDERWVEKLIYLWNVILYSS